MSGKMMVALGFAWSLIALPALADVYPQRPIRMIIPSPPGGGTDIVARLVAKHLTDALGQTVIVENRAGGNNNIAAELAAKATPDGHTLLIASATILAVNSVLGKVTYDPAKDFAPITLLGSQPHLMVVHPTVPANSVQEFVALAKSKPSQLNLASGGTGGPSHLAGELLMLVAGIKLTHIAYKGTGPALVDLIGGRTQVGILSLASALTQVKAGRLRALAVTSPKRVTVVPEYPTIAESGYPGYEARTWYGLLVPGRTPKTVITRLYTETKTVLQNPEVVRKLADDGAEPGGNSPAEFAAYIREESDRWSKVIRSAGIKAE
ncbi:MAG: tripartite tricarboxylate transporter substrate binding protein [Betaproteobacteria bacterium]|nr:tripartite tricarboxylate transporter substrate binding protein [Betaproteobacteria bacterium]